MPHVLTEKTSTGPSLSPTAPAHDRTTNGERCTQNHKTFKHININKYRQFSKFRSCLCESPVLVALAIKDGTENSMRIEICCQKITNSASWKEKINAEAEKHQTKCGECFAVTFTSTKTNTTFNKLNIITEL